MSRAKRNLSVNLRQPDQRKGGGATTRWRVAGSPREHDFRHPMWPAFQRREEGCQGSRCGRLGQPLTTLFPEQSSRPDRMTDRSAQPCPAWMSARLGSERDPLVATLPFALSRSPRSGTRCTLVSGTFRCCNLPNGLRRRLLCHHDQATIRSHRDRA